MNKPKLVLHIWGDEEGATAIEYGLICGIMAVALIAVAATGGALDTVYDRVSQVIVALGG